jgi:hypothetical protein
VEATLRYPPTRAKGKPGLIIVIVVMVMVPAPSPLTPARETPEILIPWPVIPPLAAIGGSVPTRVRVGRALPPPGVNRSVVVQRTGVVGIAGKGRWGGHQAPTDQHKSESQFLARSHHNALL